MINAADLLFAIGSLLLVIGFIQAIPRAFRHGEWHRLDTLFVVALLVMPLLIRGSGPTTVAVRFALFHLLPYALFRLVRHFRDVPGWLAVPLLVPPAVALTAKVLLPRVPYLLIRSAVELLAATAVASVAMVFVSEAARAVGVKRRRLGFAAAGTLLFAIDFISSAAGYWIATAGVVFWRTLTPTVEGLALICYYFAFSTPRRLLSQWRQAEQAKYLAGIAQREPEERAQMAPGDL
ncbi:MAG: hypothetical protein ABI652_08595, partial [Acidobacteriota bacterium]